MVFTGAEPLAAAIAHDGFAFVHADEMRDRINGSAGSA